MIQSLKLLLTSGQFWLRMLLAFLIPYILLASIMQSSQHAINEALSDEGTPPRLALIGHENIPDNLLQELKTSCIIKNITDKNEILLSIDADSIDIGLVFPDGFKNDSSNNKSIEAYYNSMQNRTAVGDVLDILENYEDNLVQTKIKEIGLSEDIVNPIKLEKTNTFNAFVLVGKIMEQVKGVLSNILNLLFILLVLWLLRNLLLRLQMAGVATNFGARLGLVYLVALSGTALVFIGFQMGIATEVEGMVRSIILSIQQLLVWNKLSAFLWLWVPSWLFIIGVMGCIINGSDDMFKAHSRTFWFIILIHIIAIIGLFPIEKIGYGQACLPIWNIFGIGQLSMRGALDNTTWYIAMIAASFWAALVNFIWFRMYIKK